MNALYLVADILLTLALLGLIGTVVWIVTAALHLKNSVMADVKRIYERPLRAVKNLAATGKGIVQQESVRIRQIGNSAKGTVSVVRETATEVKTAGAAVHMSDLKPALATAQNALKLLSAAAQLSRSVAKQGPIRH